MKLSKAQLIKMYRQMCAIRFFEEKTYEIYTQGFMPGLAHLYIGEEAVAVGVCAALKPDDCITSTHRGHGHLIAKGGDLFYMMAEIMGKKTGYCRGKGGSMHIADFSIGILGANGIVGGGIPLAVGAGLALKKEGKKRVSISFFGDGASNQGSFHEAANLASVWKLPVVFVCENNGYGISVSQARHQAITDISIRAKSYGMPGVTADGCDVLEVYKAAKKAVEHARGGKGPILVEYKTYRWYGHHVGDPGKGILYRSEEEMVEQQQKCSIGKLEKYLLDNDHLTSEDVKNIHQEIRQELESAVEKAKQEPYPASEELYEGLYA